MTVSHLVFDDYVESCLGNESENELHTTFTSRGNFD